MWREPTIVNSCGTFYQQFCSLLSRSRALSPDSWKQKLKRADFCYILHTFFLVTLFPHFKNIHPGCIFLKRGKGVISRERNVPATSVHSINIFFWEFHSRFSTIQIPCENSINRIRMEFSKKHKKLGSVAVLLSKKLFINWLTLRIMYTTVLLDAVQWQIPLINIKKQFIFCKH